MGNPKPIYGVSEYAAFLNNPLWFNDIQGDTPTVANRVWGGLQALGGLTEMAAGAAGGAATSWTGVGAVVGGVAVVHGADVTSAGLMQMWTGEETPTITHGGVSSGLKAAGVSESTANNTATVVDGTISLASTAASVRLASKTKPLPMQQPSPLLIGTSRDRLISSSDNPKLKEMVGSLWRQGARYGDGSTGAMIKLEKAEGIMTSASGSHMQKANEALQDLNKLLNGNFGTLTDSDRKVIFEVIENLTNGTGAKWIRLTNEQLKGKGLYDFFK